MIMTDQIRQETADPGVIQDVLDASQQIEANGPYGFGWHDTDEADEEAVRGLNDDVVRNITEQKEEPKWMLKTRLKVLRYFEPKPMPTWGADMSGIDFAQIK